MSGNDGIGLSESREQAVRVELDRLLGSAAFRTSKRCREFLQYIVEQTIVGQSGALKERSLGVELFRLPTDFDPGQHTIVRVTANEVRKKLAQHYLSENGASHPVRIDLPPGSYRAEFRWETLAAEPAAELAVGRPSTDRPAADPVPETHGAESAPEVPALKPTAAEPPVRVHPSAFTQPLIVCSIAVVLAAGAFLWWRGAAKPVSADAKSSFGALPTTLINGEDFRMVVGSTTPYVDRSGQVWGPERYFSGGSVVVRPSSRIFRTLDPDIYRRVRQGDFKYDIPLKPGSYELRLHFAETGLAAILFT